MRSWARPLVHSFLLENNVARLSCFVRKVCGYVCSFISEHIHLLIKFILCIYFVYVFFFSSSHTHTHSVTAFIVSISHTHSHTWYKIDVVVCPVFNRKSFESFSLRRCKAGLQSANVSLMWCFYLLIYLNCHLFENVYLSRLLIPFYLSLFMSLLISKIFTSLPLHCFYSHTHTHTQTQAYSIVSFWSIFRACVCCFEWETFLS